MADETLRGWNAIADFLSCDVRTAKRWEQYRRLPVHRTRRTPGEGRPNVYALASELDAWLASANALPEILPSAPETPGAPPPIEPPQPTPQLTESRPTPEPADAGIPQPARWSRPALAAAVASAALVTLMAWGALRLAGRESPAHPGSATAHRPAAPSNPQDARAQELFLHGSYLFEQRTPETLNQARLDFQSAIAVSPKYAPAYAGLAKTYALLREYSTLPSAQAYSISKQAAQKAIALDPNLADAHAALGYEEFFWEWNATQAEVEFKQAIALDPNSVLAHHWYGSMLTHQTRYADAIDQLNQAQMLDPESAGILGSRAYAIGLSGKRDQAVDLLQDILTRLPDSGPLHIAIAELCIEQPRDIPRYLDQMRRWAQLRRSGEQLALLNAGEPAYREHGEHAMWQAMLRAERRLHPDTQHPTYYTAQLEAALGMKDAALRDLNLLLRDHNEQLIGIEIDPLLSSLASDPRFARITRQIGLPPPTPPAPNQPL